jgi:predicted neuraminidase
MNESSMNDTGLRQTLFPDGAFFLSCHASTVLPLDDGTVLAAYFAGSREGSPDTGIWLSRRLGGIWQDPACIAKVGAVAHWNPVLFRSGGGIRLIFKTGIDVPSWRSWTQCSLDQGATWSPAVSFPEPDAACGPVRSKPIILSNGCMLAPNSIETEEEWLPRIDISEDDGIQFRLLAMVPINRTDPQAPRYLAGKGAIQPALWESAPGHVHLFLRTTCGSIFRSDSSDDGLSWCEAYDSGLPNNNSGIEISRRGPELYLIMNPVSENWGSRTPLVIRKSTDNGGSFQPFATLEDTVFDTVTGAAAEYSYPAAVIMNDRLHVTYTCNRRQIAYRVLDLDSARLDGLSAS